MHQVIGKRSVKRALVWMGLFAEPLSALYSLLPVILRKSLGVSVLEITLLIMLRPVGGLLSFYWSSSTLGKRVHLKNNYLWAGLFLRLPFLFFPFFTHRWWYFASASLYMLFYRAGYPAWMEVIKGYLSKEEREKFFSISQGLSYAFGCLLALLVGPLLDQGFLRWQWLFFLGALIGYGGLWLQYRVPAPSHEEDIEGSVGCSDWRGRIAHPWREGWKRLKENPSFYQFQKAFMWGGMGLMLLQPALPLFFVDTLHLSYTDCSLAILFCKGAGFSLSSPFWSKCMGYFSVESLCKSICLLFALFPLLLCTTYIHLFSLYIAYFVYGVASGGSHLLWHLSGPLFSKDRDSVVYSSVNVAAIGIRGLVGPPLGSLMVLFFPPMWVLLLGGTLCYLGSRQVRKLPTGSDIQ